MIPDYRGRWTRAAAVHARIECQPNATCNDVCPSRSAMSPGTCRRRQIGSLLPAGRHASAEQELARPSFSLGGQFRARLHRDGRRRAAEHPSQRGEPIQHCQQAGGLEFITPAVRRLWFHRPRQRPQPRPQQRRETGVSGPSSSSRSSSSKKSASSEQIVQVGDVIWIVRIVLVVLDGRAHPSRLQPATGTRRVEGRRGEPDLVTFASRRSSPSTPLKSTESSSMSPAASPQSWGSSRIITACPAPAQSRVGGKHQRLAVLTRRRNARTVTGSRQRRHPPGAATPPCPSSRSSPAAATPPDSPFIQRGQHRRASQAARGRPLGLDDRDKLRRGDRSHIRAQQTDATKEHRAQDFRLPRSVVISAKPVRTASHHDPRIAPLLGVVDTDSQVVGPSGLTRRSGRVFPGVWRAVCACSRPTLFAHRPPGHWAGAPRR